MTSVKLRSAALLVAMAVVLIGSSPAMAQRGGRGGGRSRGGFGPGPGGMGPAARGWLERWREENDPAKKAQRQAEDEKKQREARIVKLAADGWAALKAQDDGAALDAFSDLLQLKPDHAEAKLGLGLTKAFANSPSAAQAPLEAAAKDKAMQRLALYNLAVVQARLKQEPRAVVTLHRYLAASVSAADEVVVNAQLTLLNGLDEKQRKAMGLLPAVLRTIDLHQKAMVDRARQERWGIAWVPVGTASWLKRVGAAELFPSQLPLLLPDGSVLPDKGKAAGANPLLPEIADEAGRILTKTLLAQQSPPNAATRPVAVAGAGATAAPSTRPIAVASVTPTAPRTGVIPPSAPPSPAATATPPAVAAANPPAHPAPGPAKADEASLIDRLAAPPPSAEAPAPKSVTTRGVAFAVAPDMLMTCDRIVSGAASVSVVNADDEAVPAEVVAIDAASGLALLKVDGGQYKPLVLANACRAGAVGVACYANPGLFKSELDVIRGDLSGAGGSFVLKMSSHPRYAGSPIVDEQGRLVAVVTATRDDPAAKLPTLPVEAVRRFCNNKFIPLAAAGATDPEQCVTEIVATRAATPEK